MQQFHHSPKRKEGMTLIEVVVAMVLIAIVAPGIYHSVVQALSANIISSQHFAAAGLGREWLEQMRGMPYANVNAGNFSTESVVLNHLGSAQDVPILATRTAVIQEYHNPPRKDIEITVDWEYRGRERSETLHSAIYLKNESIPNGIRGDISGGLSINPNNSPNNQFLLTLSDGTTISRADLHRDTSTISGLASQVQFQPQGNGSQNTLMLNGESFTVFNNQTYRIEGDDMQVEVYNTHVNPAGRAVGQWRISISGNNAEIHMD